VALQRGLIVTIAALGAVVGILESGTLAGIIHAMEMDCPRRPHERHTEHGPYLLYEHKRITQAIKIVSG
jgi:hypothetical protein